MTTKTKKCSLRMADGGEAVTRWAGHQMSLRMQAGGDVAGLIGGERLAQQNAATAASSIVKGASQRAGVAQVAGAGRGFVNPALANPAAPTPVGIPPALANPTDQRLAAGTQTSPGMPPGSTTPGAPLVGTPGSSADIQFDPATRTLSNAGGRAITPAVSPLTMSSAQNQQARNSLLDRTPSVFDASKRPMDGLFMKDGGEAPPTSLRGMYQSARRLFTPAPATQLTPAPAPAPAASAPAPTQGISGYVANGALARREAAAGLQDGGQVPGSGTGDKIPAKYEPGEFVVSNDMIDDNPGLRETLHSLRAETLAARGKTVAEANAGAVKGNTLRAMDGADWAKITQDELAAGQRGIDSMLNEKVPRGQGGVAGRDAAIAAQKTLMAQPAGEAARYAATSGVAPGGPAAPAAPAPAAAPVAAETPRTGLKGIIDQGTSVGNKALNTIKSAGPDLVAGIGGAALAHYARNLGAPTSTTGPGPAVSANVAQIPTDGYAAAPAKQPYNAFTDTDVGRNVGNTISALSMVPGVGQAGAALKAAGTPAKVAQAANLAGSALLGGAGAIAADRAGTNAAPAAATPEAPQPQTTAPAAAAPAAPVDNTIRLGASGMDGFTAAPQATEDVGQFQAPVVRHSGNDWQARNNLRNLEVSASSINQRRPRGGMSVAEAAYLEGLKQDQSLRGGSTPADVAGIKAGSEFNQSRNTLRGAKYLADQRLKGDQVPLQVEGMKLQMQRNMMGAMQQITAAHTGKDGEVDTVGAANTARKAGLTSVADEFDKASAARQGLASKGQEMERGIYDHVRKGVAGQYNHMVPDGNIERTKAVEDGAASAILQMHPELRSMTQAQINEKLPRFRAEYEAMQVFRNPQDYGYSGAMPSFLGNDLPRDPMTMRPAHSVLKGAEIRSPANALTGWASPNKTKGDRELYTPSGRNLKIPAGTTNEGLAVLQDWISEANASGNTLRAK